MIMIVYENKGIGLTVDAQLKITSSAGSLQPPAAGILHQPNKRKSGSLLDNRAAVIKGYLNRKKKNNI